MQPINDVSQTATLFTGKVRQTQTPQFSNHKSVTYNSHSCKSLYARLKIKSNMHFSSAYAVYINHKPVP